LGDGAGGASDQAVGEKKKSLPRRSSSPSFACGGGARNGARRIRGVPRRIRLLTRPPRRLRRDRGLIGGREWAGGRERERGECEEEQAVSGRRRRRRRAASPSLRCAELPDASDAPQQTPQTAALTVEDVRVGAALDGLLARRRLQRNLVSGLDAGASRRRAAGDRRLLEEHGHGVGDAEGEGWIVCVR